MTLDVSGSSYLFVYGLENNVIHIKDIQTGSWDIRLGILERRNADIIILCSSKETSGSVKEYASL